MSRSITFVALCPRTGVHLRPATPEEVAAYHAAQKHPRYRVGSVAFSDNVPMGEVTIASDTGPGLWFGGAGF